MQLQKLVVSAIVLVKSSVFKAERSDSKSQVFTIKLASSKFAQILKA